MKPVFRSVLCILCTVALLFTGCENPFARREEESSSLVEYAADTVYTEIPLPMPEDIQEDPVFHDKTIDVWFAADTGMQGVYTSAEGEKMTVLYDWSGNLIHTAPLPETELQSIRTFRPLSDGTLLLFVNERESADAFITGNALLITEENGTVLHRYAFDDSLSGTVYLAVSEEQIAMVNAETLYLFDLSLNLLASHTLVQSPVYLHANGIGWADEKTLYFHGGDSLVYLLNTENGYLSPLYEKSTYSGRDTQQYSTHEDYLIWEVNHDGIWGIPRPGASSQDPVPVCSWAGSCMSHNLIEILYIHGDGTVFCRSSDNIDSRPVYSLLRPKGSVIPKETVVVAAFHDANTTFLKKLVSLFNRKSDSYIMDLRLYESSMYPGGMEDTSKELFGMLHRGEVPDLLLVNNWGEALYRNLENQGYLADLSAFTEPLTASAAEASRYKGTHTRLPVLIRYETLLTACGTEPLTTDGLLAARDTLTDGQALFSANISRKLTAALQAAFVDHQAETCDFDTPSFLSCMELLRDLGNVTNPALGTPYPLQVDGNMTLQLTNSTLPDSLQAGKVRYLELPLWSVSCWLFAKLCYPAEDPYVCGYPGTAAMPSLDCSLVQFREGKNPAGAAAFLEFVLSDTIQTSAAVTDFAFPVTSSALDTILEPSWYTVDLTTRPGTDANGEKVDVSLIRINNVSIGEPKPSGIPEIRIIQFTETDKAALRAIAENESVCTVPDPTIETILNEELSVYLSGDRSAEETAHILQSRISMYLAE